MWQAWKSSSLLPEVFLIHANYAMKIDTIFARTMKTDAYHVYCVFKNVYKWRCGANSISRCSGVVLEAVFC